MAREDHWFKFYYHRILVSCAGWKDDEFGAFVKLLIHQFDKGHIPADEAEIKRLITSFKKNWPLLKTKFTEEEPGKLINHVMNEVRLDRIKKAEKNRENGGKGGRPKKPSGLFLGSENKRHIYSNSNSDSEIEDGGTGEETELPADPQMLVPAMALLFTEAFPDRFEDKTEDYPALRELAEKINGSKRITGPAMEKIKVRWGEIVAHIKQDGHLCKYSLVQVNKHYSSIIQSFNAAKERTKGNKIDPKGSIGKHGNGKSAGAHQLLASLKDELASGINTGG